MNKVNVFRVDNPLIFLYMYPIGMGPYYFFGHVAGKEKNAKWAAHCDKHEPNQNTYNKFKINSTTLKKVPTLSKERRPGPFEDIELRSKMIERMGRMTKDGQQYYYCFNSIQQFKDWFHDMDELKFLAEHCFTLSHYIVDAASFLNGLKQAVFFKEGFLYLKTRYNILTLDPLLPISDLSRIPKPA